MGTVPARANVYGGFTANCGLDAVLDALRPLFGDKAVVVISHAGYGDVLILQTDSAVFHTVPMGKGEHLFDGGVGGTLDEVIGFTRRLSEALQKAGIDHGLHVTDGPMNYVASFPPE